MAKTRVAHAEAAVTKRLHDMSADLLVCRDLRHSWTVDHTYYEVEMEEGQQGYERVLLCTRCTTRRVDTYVVQARSNRALRLIRVASSYTYPKDYHITNVPKNLSIGQLVRYETLRRTLTSLAAGQDG